MDGTVAERAGWTNLYRLKVGDEFELGNSRQVQLRVAGDQLVQSGVQGLLEHQHLAVARVLHQPLHKVSHLVCHKVVNTSQHFYTKPT